GAVRSHLDAEGGGEGEHPCEVVLGHRVDGGGRACGRLRGRCAHAAQPTSGCAQDHPLRPTGRPRWDTIDASGLITCSVLSSQVIIADVRHQGRRAVRTTLRRTMSPGRLWNKDFTVALSISVFLGFVFYLLVTAMVGYAVQRFAAGEAEAGLASTAFVLGSVLTRPLAGKLLDVVGR